VPKNEFMTGKTTKKRRGKNCRSSKSKYQNVSLGGSDEFFNRFEKMAEIAGCKDACKLLSKKSRAMLYLLRIHLTQPRVDKGEPIDKEQAKVLATLFRNLREKRDIELIKGKEKRRFQLLICTLLSVLCITLVLKKAVLVWKHLLLHLNL